MRLKTKYDEEIVPTMKKEFSIENKLALPRLRKIVINMGVGRALENKRRLESAVQDMTLISGQRPIVTRAKKSIAGFKLREGNDIGCKVTLRGVRMYEFLDRLVSIVIPRIRDFRGLSNKSFDKAGNYSIGLKEQSVFPEINLDKIEFYQGMDITMVVSNSDREKSLSMLGQLGVPFKQ